MSAGNLTRLLGLAAALGSVACRGTSVPRDWLPSPREAQTTAYGGWVEIHHSEGQNKRLTLGELIAATADSIWVLNDSKPVVVATAAVESGKLSAYDPRLGNVTGWMVAGLLSTVSNGVFLVITAPVWLVTGGLAGQSEARAAQRASPPRTWAELALFSRFPQGMPDGIALGDLRAKQGKLNGP